MEPPRNRRRKGAREVSRIAADDSGGLGRAIGHARRIQALGHVLQPLLPRELAPYVDVANLRQGCLVLAVSSAAAATRLRMESDALLPRLREKSPAPIETIEVRIVPAASRTEAHRKPRELSPSARSALQDMGVLPSGKKTGE